MPINKNETCHKIVRKTGTQNTSLLPFLLRLHFPWLLSQLLRKLFPEAAVYLETGLMESVQAPCGKHGPLRSSAEAWQQTWPERPGSQQTPQHVRAGQRMRCVRQRKGIYLRARASSKACQTAQPALPWFTCVCVYALQVQHLDRVTL